MALPPFLLLRLNETYLNTPLMASPFSLFRKHQKMLMVIATLIAIFIFVVGDALMSRYGSHSQATGEALDARATAVHWDGGKLSNRELNELVFRRRVLNHFLQNIEMEGTRPSVMAGVDPPELRVQRMLAPETPQQQVESSVVKTKLLAEAAAKSGMKISDETLVNYLNELGRRNVTPAQMRAMVGSSSSGAGRLSIDYVLEALREEMLARNYLNTHVYAFQTVTPEQRWKDWSRVNDRVIVEAAAVPAELYLPDVKEPTDAELAAFFEKYKDREPVPDLYGNLELPSALPGFRVPRKVDVQFIEASYDEHLAKAEAKITDEEIAKFYEENKSLFPKMNVGLKEDTAKESPSTDAPAAKEEQKNEATEAPPADAEKKAEEKKADEKPAEEKKAEEPAANPVGPAEKKDAPPAEKTESEGEKAAEEAKESSSIGNPAKSVFRLTAFAEDVAKKENEAGKEGEEAADAPAANPDAAETKAADQPAANPPAPANTPEVPAATPAPPAAPAAPATEKPFEAQPLSEVKDEIRKRLAETQVAEELSKIISSIEEKLQPQYEKWRYADTDPIVDADGKKELPPPPKSLTDLAALAENSGLKHGVTGPRSLLQLRELPIGKSTAIDANRLLLSLLFTGDELGMYQPVKTVDIDGNRYIAMKMSDTPAKTPTLAEVKDEVIKAWKLEKASELAKKHAEEYAKKAEENKTPLANFFADDKAIKVIRTDPFSELTGGEVGMVGGQVQQQPYRFSQPNDIVAAGPDFLRGVFNLKDGQVGVLMNNDNSIAYVVRVVEHTPALAELRNNYLMDAFTWYGEGMMNQLHRQEIASNLERDIEDSNNLKWDRDPDKAKNEPSDEG